jgi:hypothetical protein
MPTDILVPHNFDPVPWIRRSHRDSLYTRQAHSVIPLYTQTHTPYSTESEFDASEEMQMLCPIAFSNVRSSLKFFRSPAAASLAQGFMIRAFHLSRLPIRRLPILRVSILLMSLVYLQLFIIPVNIIPHFPTNQLKIWWIWIKSHKYRLAFSTIRQPFENIKRVSQAWNGIGILCFTF